MRVLIDGRGLLEELKAGVESYTWLMLKFLVGMYPDDEYILFSYSWHKAPSIEQKELVEWVHYKWPNIIMSVSWPWLGYPAVDGLVSGVDVVWMPNVRFMPTGRGVKRVATVHDLSFEIMPDCFSQKRRLWHWHMRIKHNLQQMDRLVAVSQNTKDDLIRQYGIRSDDIKLIYSGIEREPADQVEVVCKKYGLEKYIITVGTIEPRKNLGGLLRSYHHYINYFGGEEDLVLVGGQGWDFEIEKLVSDLGLSGRVKFLGFVTEKDKLSLIAGAKLLVFVSFYEGFGFPPLEAMAQDIPTMVSHGGSLGEVVQDAAWVVDPLDIKAMAGGIDSLINSPDLGQELVERGRMAVKKYNWQNTACQFHELLEEIHESVEENVV